MKVKVCGILFVFMLTLIAACKSGVENETNKYNNNQIDLKKFAAKYPAFHSQLFLVSQNAAKLIEDSKKISDGEKKAKKLAEANSVFMGSVVFRQLNSYDGRKERIIKLKDEFRPYREIEHKNTAQKAIEAANNGLIEAGKIMNDAIPATKEEAKDILKKANSILMGVEGTLYRAKKKIKGAKKKGLRKKKK